ncbi:ATP-binding protein [uncultured Mucilaginibacter sp.]|uniref:ATP-binding protein n=1 Tax=uncultured Mucilaginibacter sp. TaxID=797541 RepID=UPI0025F07802|nr:ATP-binding protein [uncultured Mucilaginibacter sp.]
MNKLLFLLFFFCFPAAYGQAPNKGDFDLNSLPANITDQWKFHAGDNPDWADTAFSDRDWKHLNPTQLQHHLPEVVNAQIGWFRLTLDVTPSLRGKAVALVVNQCGAAEIYFNGALIRKMGRVSADYTKEQVIRSVGEPLILQLNHAPRQYVVIRYSFNRSNPVIGYGQPVITASFKQVDSAWDAFFLDVDFYTTRSWVSGCFMLLVILQLAIYFFNPERKVNLYLSIYAFLQLLTLWDGLLSPILQGTGWYTIMLAIFCFAAPADFVFFIMMTYAFFSYPRGRWFLVLAIFCIPVVIIQFIGDNVRTEHVLAVYNVLCYIEVMRISVKALRQKKAGAGLLLAGIILALIFFVLFNIDDFIDLQPFLLICFEAALAFLTPAIILSILLAREFAQNLVSLRQKLTEVESLSVRSLQQEAEKQQLLARQNEMLEQKVTERTAELHQSITELKSTQNQLIQSEKMASLGELTAGIAHEIQNPLNFVNNFSEVSTELTQELKEELRSGHTAEAIAIADDLEQNLDKINHHGKRAGAIVNGMLEHSRKSTGTKEPTDINALADEYFRLSYHGLRAKDKAFNAEMTTNLDGKLPKANIIPQDIGRVLLNLFNNAFYAVYQKQKTAAGDYKPVVTVTTSTGNNQVIIKVKDNGNGIPDETKDKIMQPFFTTKPTGEGTGLGLSLSYDIVVKVHGGTIDLDTKEGRYTEFTVTLPI